MMGEMPLNVVQLCEVLNNPNLYVQALIICFSVQTHSIMLTLIGAKNPNVFQIVGKLDIEKYTNSVPEFYTPL